MKKILMLATATALSAVMTGCCGWGWYCHDHDRRWYQGGQEQGRYLNYVPLNQVSQTQHS